MGDSAEDLKDDVRLDEAEDEIEIEEEEALEGEESETVEGDEAGGEQAENEEFEVVLEGAGDAPRFTQSDVDSIVQRRLARQKGKGEAESEEAVRLREENKLLKLALEQKKSAGPPKPDDFDGGEFDPAYVKARSDFESATREAEVARLVEDRYRRDQEDREKAEKARALEGKQREHYTRAAALKVKDYEATEDVAIEHLGQDTVNHLIANFDDSHALLYYLGKNPGEASRLAGLIRANPIQGIAEIGGLRRQIRVRPKSSKRPEPETQLEGAGASSGDPGPKGVKYE